MEDNWGVGEVAKLFSTSSIFLFGGRLSIFFYKSTLNSVDLRHIYS